VNGFGIGRVVKVGEFFENAIHPVGESAVLGFCAFGRRNCCR
jgi:hypothetical protein